MEIAECKQMDPTLHPNWQLLNDKFCGTRGSDRIVGGKTPELGDFPWIARVGYTNYVKPICMIYGDQLTKSYIKEYTEVAGWGISHIDNPQPSTILQAVKLPVRDLQTCIDSFKVFAKIGPTQICVGGKEGEDSCGGDSGGPLMKVEAEHGLGPRYYLLGVVSFGAKKCGSSTMPGIYTRVADFMDWILDRMRP
ncbi:hypothetical protein C0J52_09758 [Blattella germanica]|nr:hypothetical protein C0J52_09758 [Blattella germanica]